MSTDQCLWCVHVLGPDDMHPAPSKEEAERACEALREYRRDEPHISFVAEPWPYSETSHAADVKFFYAVTGLTPLSALKDVLK